MFTLQKSKKKRSSRSQISIQGVKDNILTLRQGVHRIILEVSSINFELKSEAEQDAIINNYQNFLNSLNCGLQVLVRIRELDVDDYLSKFKDGLKGERQMTYQEQVKDYARFVKSLINTNKILARRFYVILTPQEDGKDFENIREELLLNADIVSKGLGKLGMQLRILPSLQILDLFYSFYNPILAKKQPLSVEALNLLDQANL